MSDAEKIKIIRKILELSQADFCQKLEISQAALSDIEKGKHGFSFHFFRLLVEEYPVNPFFFLKKGIQGFPPFTDEGLNKLFARQYPEAWQEHLEETIRLSAEGQQQLALQVKSLQADMQHVKERVQSEPGETGRMQHIEKQLKWLQEYIVQLQAGRRSEK